MAAYDTIGRGYGLHRRADPRIAALVEEAIGGSSRVLNVGAGQGSYEPHDRPVLAIDPSRLMVAGRPAGAAPVTLALAEALPVADGAFDVATALLTLHHWDDWRAGLAELRRVAHRQVVFSFEPTVHLSFWLITEYFPGIAGHRGSHPPTPEAIAEALGGGRVQAVPVPADCQDGFLWAHWARPAAYLDPAVQDSTSGMALLDEASRRRGTAALAEDLASGRWAERHADLLARRQIDGGFRLIVSGEEPPGISTSGAGRARARPRS